MTTQPGALVAGRYRLAEPVGQGGMGRVWRAHDLVLDRDIAIKELLLPAQLSAAEHAELIRRTTREARAAARLNHPGVVTVHDVVEYGGAPWIVMEYIAGRSLGTLITADGPLPWRRAAGIGAKIADALAHAHAAGIVHRDLKPDNVLLAGERVVVTDFGIARILDRASRLTLTGAILGTPHYMAPEQLDGGEAGSAADMWSLGATLYTAVEGRPPFDGPTLTAVVAAILTRDAAPPEHAGALAPVLAGLLIKNPLSRPAASETARTLAAGDDGTDAQGSAAGAGPVQSPRTVTVIPSPGAERPAVPDPPMPASALAPTSRSRRWMLAVAVPLALVAAALGTYFGLSSHGPTGPGTTGDVTSPPATAGAGLTGATASGSATPARSASPSALASSSAPPPPVGDACLIGTWRDNGYTQTATSDGSTVSIHGGAGNLDYIAASGVDDNIYGAGTAPFYGTLEGHPLTVTYKGTKILLLRANPGTHTVIVTYKGWTSGSTIAGEVEGRTASDPLTKSADQVSTEGYSCSATTLTWTLAGKVTDTEKRVSEKS